MEAHEYDQISAARDQTIESWQLEDALNALKQTESLIASLENNHARESEQLHTAIAALEHTAKQRQIEVKQLEEKLRVRQEQAEQQLASANYQLKKLQAARIKETRHYAAENNKLRGLIKASKRHIELQASALADLDQLCNRREAEIEDGRQAIEQLRQRLEALSRQAVDEAANLQQTIGQQRQCIEGQDRTIANLRAQCKEKDNELVEVVRLYDRIEGKLADTTEQHAREAAHLQLTINRLQKTLREQQTRANDLQQQRDDLEKELSVRLSDLNQESEQNLTEAKERYESQFGNLQSKIDDLESLVSDRASQVQQLSSKIFALKAEHAQEIACTEDSANQAVESANHEQQAKVEELRSSIVQLKDVHAKEIASSQASANQAVTSAKCEYQAEIEKLSSTIVQLKDDYAKEIASTRASADEALELANSKHQAEVQQLQSVMGSLENAFEASISEKRSVQAKAEDLQRQCESLKKNPPPPQVDHSAQIKRLEQSIRAGQERIKSEKLKEARRLKAEVAALKKQLQVAGKDGGHFKQESRRLARRLSQQVAHHSRTRDYLYQRISTLQKELEPLRRGGRAAA